MIERKVSDWNSGTGTFQLANTQRLIWADWHLLAEQSVSGSTVALLRGYTWGLDLSSTLGGAGGVGGLLALHDATTGERHLPSYDGNGNVLALIKATDQQETARYEYGAFGQTVRSSGTSAERYPFRYSTKYADGHVGLLFYGRRFLDPGKGRWLSRDPLAERAERNLYGFVKNRPTSYFDAFGLYHANENECGVCLVKSIKTVYMGFAGPVAGFPHSGAHHSFHTLVELYPPGGMQPVGIKPDPTRCRFRQEVKGYSTFDGEFQKFSAGDERSGERPEISMSGFVDDQYSNADNKGSDLNWEFHDSPGISPRTPAVLQVFPPPRPLPDEATWVDWFLEFRAIVEDEDPITKRRVIVAEKKGHWVSMKGYWPNVRPEHGGF